MLQNKKLAPPVAVPAHLDGDATAFQTATGSQLSEKTKRVWKWKEVNYWKAAQLWPNSSLRVTQVGSGLLRLLPRSRTYLRHPSCAVWGGWTPRGRSGRWAGGSAWGSRERVSESLSFHIPHHVLLGPARQRAAPSRCNTTTADAHDCVNRGRGEYDAVEMATKHFTTCCRPIWKLLRLRPESIDFTTNLP